MTGGIQRRLAATICRFLIRILPARLEHWGWAIRNEIAEIDDDRKALLFALQSLWGMLPSAFAMHLLSLFAAVKERGKHLTGAKINMGLFGEFIHRPRRIGIVSASGAVVLGLAYMIIADAPVRYLTINAGALALGLLAFAVLGRRTAQVERWSGQTTLVLAAILLATALLGEQVQGAARWVDLGPLFVQPSLILLPFMIIVFARSRAALSVVGLLVTAIALAVQPDRAMAGMLLAGLAALNIVRCDRVALAALIGSAIGFAATLAQADTLPAMPFVDQVLYTSFDVSLFAGLAVLGGAILLVVPAIIGLAYDTDNRETYCVFGAVWIAAIAAAAVGNYPTPVVGYSGGAVLGYVLSLIQLPKIARSRRETLRSAGSENDDANSINGDLRFAGA
jgi:membrane-associated HD superfamily phosphohydrolase